MKKICRKRSFTLIEMLIAMSLLSIVLYSLVLLLDQTEKAMSTGVAKMNVVEDARLVLDRIQNDFNNIDAATIHSLFDTVDNDGNTTTTQEIVTGSTNYLCIYTTRMLDSTVYPSMVEYYLDGHCLKEDVTYYNRQKGTDGSVSVESTKTVTLLNNVLNSGFSAVVNVERSSGGQEIGRIVVINLQMVDAKTVAFAANHGTANVKDARENAKKGTFDEGVILKKYHGEPTIRDQAMQHFSRIIYLDKNSI